MLGMVISGIELFAGEFAGMAARRRDGIATHALLQPHRSGMPRSHPFGRARRGRACGRRPNDHPLCRHQ
ncbi:hypothetical protein BLAT2472_20775 [Burkholderia latens]